MNSEIQPSTRDNLTRERITARVSSEVYATLNAAAQLSGTSLNSFMVQAALQQAQDLIDSAKMRCIQVTDEAEAAWFLAKFEEKFVANPKLAKALAQYNEAIHANKQSDQGF